MAQMEGINRDQESLARSFLVRVPDDTTLCYLCISVKSAVPTSGFGLIRVGLLFVYLDFGYCPIPTTVGLGDFQARPVGLLASQRNPFY